MRKWLNAACLAAGMATTVLAQQPAALPPPNEQVVQYYRALMSAGGTQAVIQAVSQAVLEAMKQGPMSPATAQQTLASVPAAANAPAAASVPTILPKTWADAITLKGDLRFREELIQDDSKIDKTKNGGKGDTYTRDRERIRARVGLEAKLTDDVKAVVRLSTDEAGTIGGGGDPISGNQTLGAGDSKKGIYLDLAYLDWNLFGEGASELHGLFGKMNNPFITMNDDLVWDPDLTPEGIGVQGRLDLSPVTLFGNAGYFWLQERNSRDPVSLLGGQGAARVEFIPEIALTVGAGLYSFQNVQGADVTDYSYDAAYQQMLATSKIATNYPSGYGNTVVKYIGKDGTPGAKWKYGYNVFQPFALLETYPTVFGRVLPVSFFGQHVENLAVDAYNTGYMYGMALGKAKNPGTFEVGASYAKLEKDATLGLWTDSDRWGGGTDGQGGKFYAKYQIFKGLQAGITYYNDDKVISDPKKTADYSRWQFDLLGSF